MASEPKTTKRLILNSNTQATKRKVRVLNYTYRVKGIQCHSNHLPQLFELKKKSNKQQNKSCYLNVFFVIFFS